MWSLGCILYQMVYGKSPFQHLPITKKLEAITNEAYPIDFPKLECISQLILRNSNPWLMDVMKSCLQRNPSKRPSIGGAGGLLQHPFLQPQGERAMQLFQAATLGNENMQDIVRQILDSSSDEVWNRPDCVDSLCKAGHCIIGDP